VVTSALQATATSILAINPVRSDQQFDPIIHGDSTTVCRGRSRPWIAEVTRKTFLSQIDTIVHSKVLVIDPLSQSPVVVTGSHNFSPI
jgi:phosphatidylserine/phosphatidylglycerophosphate/cardiolipin synthase-like enzyme